MTEKVLALIHKAALPYCSYDKRDHKIILRVVALEDVDRMILIYGDPYDRDTSGGKDPLWRYQEGELRRQFSGAGPGIWNIEIAVPTRRRLKYGFRVISGSREFYFSENGVEPYTPEAVNRAYNHFSFPFIHAIDSPELPGWVQHTIWYQIFPERFRRGNPAISPPESENWETGVPGNFNFFGGDLAGIRQKLDYLGDLGINGLYLTPVFRSPSNHKYNVQDYFALDEHFGDPGELKALIAQAHHGGIRVMLDAVFNHCGETHPFWQDVLQNQERSPYRDYFHIHRFPVKTSYPDQSPLHFDTFGFYTGMPKWNTEHPEARQYLLDSAAYWIREYDIDGWRLDVANEVSFDFWKDFSALARSLKKEFYLVGEVWYDASNWLHRGSFDAAMNYPLECIISDYFLKRKIPADRFTETLFTLLARYSDLHNRVSFNLLDSHDTERALFRAGEDKRALRSAFTMLFLLPGSPCIYYGTETGMTGGPDPDCRRPMVWDEARQDRELRRFFQELISFRKTYAALINHCGIHYSAREGLHCWEFSDGKETLTAVYAEGDPRRIRDLPGDPVFAADASGEVPPYTMAIYHQKV
jgi:glycosidase